MRMTIFAAALFAGIAACAAPRFTIVNGVLTDVELNGATSVTIPDSVTSIGTGAFEGCSGLTSIKIPDSVTSIGDVAFWGCSGLKSITIPGSVTSIGDWVFDGCSSLVSFEVAAENPAYKSVNGLLLSKDGKTLILGVNGDVIIPDGVTRIGEIAFYCCSGLTSITIPDGVTHIGGFAFEGCIGLTSIVIPDSVTSIGDYAFEDCSGITSVTIPQCVCNSRFSVIFRSCQSITNVVISDSVTSIGDNAFNGCSGLTSIVIPDGVTSIGRQAFFGCNESLYDETTIPGVRLVDGWVVGWTDILSGALDLTGVRGIGDWAFSGCSGLTSITIPSSVTSIGNWAFSGCNALTCVTMGGNAPYEVADDAFEGVAPGCVVCIPRAASGYDVVDGKWQGMAAACLNFDGEIMPWAPVFYPESGTIIDGTLSIAISCATEGAVIHYTTDGSDPTEESPVYRRFRISKKTTVKAIAVKDGVASDIAIAQYAAGKCADPRITPADGTVLHFPERMVSISWDKSDGVLRYTLNGSEPVETSPVYKRPFKISGTTTVKAKVFGCEFLDSGVATSVLTFVKVPAATPAIEAAAVFTGSKTKVSISCATPGATIRYTLDGSEPGPDSPVYSKPFFATSSCTVKAFATRDYYSDSATAVFAIERAHGIGDAMGAPDHAFSTGGTGYAGWTSVTDATASGGAAMKSGAISNGQTSSLSTTLAGPGTLRFSWRSSCEDDPDGYFEWDRAELLVDGETICRIDGETGWTDEEVRIEGEGMHVVEWRYVKDDVEGAGEDAAWVTGYSWESDWTETRTTKTPVPYAWLREHVGAVVDDYVSYESAANGAAANGRKVWECYVLGLDPENAAENFSITAFKMKSDGTPDLDAIRFSPDKERWNVSGARAVLEGAPSPSGPWSEVAGAAQGDRAAMRFFRISLVMP